MKTKDTKKYIRWAYLVCGVIAMLFAGIVYAWSILKAPLAQEFGWTASELGLNFTITMAFFCTGGVLGGVISGKVGPKIPLVIAAVGGCAGFALTSQLDGSSVWMLYLSYGVIAAVSIGIAYNVIISTVSAWFSDRIGVCSGALMMGFGSSALVLGQVASMLIEHPDAGWRMAMRVLGIALGAVLLLSAALLRRPQRGAVAENSSSIQKQGGQKDCTTFEMFRRPSFWMSFICITFLAAVGNSVISFAKDLSLAVGAAPALATTLVGVLSVCNGLGRIATGMLFDRLGRRPVMMIMNLTSIVAAAVILGSILINALPLYIIGVCMAGASYGACPTVNSVIVADFYGKKHFPVNFSVMNFNVTSAACIAGVANNLLMSSGSFVQPFVMLLVLTFAALALNVKIKQA